MGVIGALLSGLLFVGVIGFLLLGFPVAFTLAGVSLMFGVIGMWFGVFHPSNFGSIANRMDVGREATSAANLSPAGSFSRRAAMGINGGSNPKLGRKLMTGNRGSGNELPPATQK